MTRENNQESSTDISSDTSDEKVKRQKLNVALLLVGLLVAGISFVWHIISIFLKN